MKSEATSSDVLTSSHCYCTRTSHSHHLLENTAFVSSVRKFRRRMNTSAFLLICFAINSRYTTHLSILNFFLKPKK